MQFKVMLYLIVLSNRLDSFTLTKLFSPFRTRLWSFVLFCCDSGCRPAKW